MTYEDFKALVHDLRARLGHVIKGQERVIDLLMIAMLSRGHILLEGPPGTAKTLLARTFAQTTKLDFKRIQFTPDLMPGDVLGANIFDFEKRAFTLTKGPIFTDILLGDEINRAPKTQAALLQAMQERQASIDGVDHELGNFFTVIATQNPIEQQGTYPLPEAQLDRFLFKVVLDFVDEESERDILTANLSPSSQAEEGPSAPDTLSPIESKVLAAGRQLVDQVRLEPAIVSYIVALVRATRSHGDFEAGASTRAAVALGQAAKAAAALDGRSYVIPDDVKDLIVPALTHRVVLSPTAEIEGREAASLIEGLIAQVEIPDDPPNPRAVLLGLLAFASSAALILLVEG